MDTSRSRRQDDKRNIFSELEGVVLGLIWFLGPCTAYSIRTTISRSPNTHGSGSAGAIYPLLRRLEKRGFCISKSFSTGKRKGGKYELTDHGRDALNDWIAPPLKNEAASIPADPIRTRLSFISSLSPEDRKSFIADAIKIIQSHIVMSEEECRINKQSDRTLDYLISRGALLTAQARLRWIEEVETAIDSQRLSPDDRPEIHGKRGNLSSQGS